MTHSRNLFSIGDALTPAPTIDLVQKARVDAVRGRLSQCRITLLEKLIQHQDQHMTALTELPMLFTSQEELLLLDLLCQI